MYYNKWDILSVFVWYISLFLIQISFSYTSVYQENASEAAVMFTKIKTIMKHRIYN